MNPQKAIEIKTTYVEHLPPGVNEDWITADKLSIEALKFYEAIKVHDPKYKESCLLGETEDSSQEAQEINPESTNP